jgi:hypothetical protein
MEKHMEEAIKEGFLKQAVPESAGLENRGLPGSKGVWREIFQVNEVTENKYIENLGNGYRPRRSGEKCHSLCSLNESTSLYLQCRLIIFQNPSLSLSPFFILITSI